MAVVRALVVNARYPSPSPGPRDACLCEGSDEQVRRGVRVALLRPQGHQVERLMTPQKGNQVKT